MKRFLAALTAALCLTFTPYSPSFAGQPTQVETCSVPVAAGAADGSCGKAKGTDKCGPAAATDSTYTKNVNGTIVWQPFSTLTPASPVMNCASRAWTTLAALTPADPVAPPTYGATLSWVAPTAFDDNKVFPEGIVVTYNVYSGVCDGAITMFNAGSVLSLSVSGLAAASCTQYSVSAVVAGVESLVVGPVTFTAPSPPPVVASVVPTGPSAVTVK